MENEKLFESEPLMDAAGSPFGIRITSANPEEAYILIPETIENLPVLEIGDYAFRDCNVREIQLPESLKRIGRYAFYNCRQLERIGLSTGLKDVGVGAFTGVHRVHAICLFIKEEEEQLTVLQELLADFSETIEVTLTFPDQEVRLLFPEYYEQGVENTPARIIVNQFYGTGMKYRNCFKNRRLQYEEYDRLFPLAAAGEREELSGRLALLRLSCPYQLKDSYRNVYRNWIREHAEQLLDSLIRENQIQSVRLILSETKPDKEIRERSALLCSELGLTEMVALFMEEERTDMQSDTEEPLFPEDFSEESKDPLIQSIFDLDEI